MPDASQLVTEPPPSVAGRIPYPPVVWLNLVCLDAPIVAVAWQWLFARTFGAHLDLPLRTLLFLTAWLIYLADRFADTIKLPPGSPISLRHRFCREHMIGWWVAIVVIFFLDVVLALRSLDLQMLLLGGTLAALCAFYLFVNHSLGGKWRPLPVKEKAIGILFAAGTTLGVVGQLPVLTVSFGVAVLLFAILCTFNCLSIAAWERELDVAQGKATVHDRMADGRARPDHDRLRPHARCARVRRFLALCISALALPRGERVPARQAESFRSSAAR